jgi:predicted dinucleotide-binding enzyme
MRIGILGTGMVGQALGTRLVGLGHEVMLGSRQAGNEKAVAWVAEVGERGHEGAFADAAAFGELLINATPGMVSLDVLAAAGAENMAGKVLIDVSNPLDFSGGFPPKLSVCNDDSMGEQIQRAYPDTRVVKSLNTLNANEMVDPVRLGSPHDIFVCGNDAAAKDQVKELLGSFGWWAESIIDLGDITSARGTEMYVALWLRVASAIGSFHINMHYLREP